MNTRQRVTRSSLGTPLSNQSSPMMTPTSSISNSLSIKSEPSTSLNNKPNAVTNCNAITKSTSIPRGLMTRDGTPASSTIRLQSDLRINPLKITPTSALTSRPATRVAPLSNSTTRGGAVKRQFKPKVPALTDAKKNDTKSKGNPVTETIPKSPKIDGQKGKKSPSKKNGIVDTRKQRDIVQMESSVFTGSASVLKPLRSSKPSTISFGPSTTVSNSSKSSSTSKETVVRVEKSSTVSRLNDEYDSDNFVVSDDSDNDKSYGKQGYSTIKPIGYESLYSQAMNTGKKKIKVEKTDSETEFNEAFNVKPASDVFMKFLSLQQVSYTKSMMLIQVSNDLLTTHTVRNPECRASEDPDMIENFIGRLRMYQSGKVEIVKPDGSVFEITRTGNENIHVPCTLPKVMFKSSCGIEKEYVLQSNAGVPGDGGRAYPKYHVVKMNLEYDELSAVDQNNPSASASSSPRKCDPQPTGGTLIEIAHVDPREDLIATPLIGESNVKTTNDDCDEDEPSMECDS